MDWLDPLDAAMMTAEVSNPLNIGAALILSPPAIPARAMSTARIGMLSPDESR